MTGLFINTAKKSVFKFLFDLAKRIGLNVKKMSDEEVLVIGLIKAMKEGRETDFVPRERVMVKFNLVDKKN